VDKTIKMNLLLKKYFIFKIESKNIMQKLYQKILQIFKPKKIIKNPTEEEKIRVRLSEINQKTRGKNVLG